MNSAPLGGMATLLITAIALAACAPKSAQETAFEPCRMSPWGEKQLAKLSEHMKLPPIPEVIETTEKELQWFSENPDVERWRLRVGVAYFRDENYDEALPYLSYEYIDNETKEMAGLYLGFLYIRRHEYVKGAEHLELIIQSQLNPDHSPYGTFAALIYSEHCMHQEAIPHLQRLVALEPHVIYLWVQLGWNYGGVGDYERAREVFVHTRQLIADGVMADMRDKGELEAYSGFVEWNAGNTQAAKSHFEQAVKNPDAPPSARHALDALNAGSEPFYARW